MSGFFCPVIIFLIASVFSKIVSGEPLWGSFRPHTLISARAAVPNSPYFGFAYHPVDSLDVRHLAADHQSKISSFSWTAHDGSNFGDQYIRDHDANILITTTFYSHPFHSACTLRISAVPLDPNRPLRPTSVVLYTVTSPEEDLSASPNDSVSNYSSLKFARPDLSSPDDHVRIDGESNAIGGRFTIRMLPPAYGSFKMESLDLHSARDQREKSIHGSGSQSRLRLRSQCQALVPDELGFFHLSANGDNTREAWAIEKIIERKLSRSFDLPSGASSVRLLDSSIPSAASSLFAQRLVQAPFRLEATLVVNERLTSKQVNDIESQLTGQNLDTSLSLLRTEYDEKFERVFALRNKGFSDQHVKFGKQALANLLGGIGFFYGSSIAKHEHEDNSRAVVLPSVGLLTATPSRIAFPRGFLWDEGFHQLLIGQWDSALSMRCVQSWFDASQNNGWIPREQILGTEARTRFPEHIRHLIIQNPLVANPPTILMPLPLLSILALRNNMTSKDAFDNRWRRETKRLIENVERYYKWLGSTQSGKRAQSFRWRGRSTQLRAPDGYPLTLSSGLDDYPRSLRVSDEERHVDLHCWVTWASRILARVTELDKRNPKKYWDHYARLRGALFEHHAVKSPNKHNREDMLLCDYDGDERICHEGYVTILPLALSLLHADDNRVSTILDALEDEAILLSKAGLRSLSRSDQWYRKGDDYWTGSVWMPFNFLTLASLKRKYSIEDGPYRERALKIYKLLRETIIQNTMDVYLETGQMWENYAPEDGKGKSSRQFTGWTSLVLLIMAEMYGDFM